MFLIFDVLIGLAKIKLQLGFPFFRIFKFPGNGEFSKSFPGIPGNFWDPEIREIHSRDSGNFRKNFSVIFLELNCFAVFF